MAPTDQQSPRAPDDRFGGRRLLRRFALKLVGEGAARLLSFVVLLWLARSLGEAAFGFYSFALAAGFVVSQGADLGTKVLVAREVAAGERQATPLVRTGLRVKLGLTVPALALIAVLAAREATAGRAVVLLALGTAMVLLTFVEYPAYVFRGSGRMAQDVMLTAGYAFLSAVAIAAALWLGGDLVAVSLAVAAAAGVSAAIAIWRLAKGGWLARGKNPSGPAGSLELVRAAAPLGIATFASIAYVRLAVLVLEPLAGEVAVAHFSVAHRLVEAMQLLPAAALAAVFPAYVTRRRRPGGGRSAALAVRTGVLLALAGIVAAVGLRLSAAWLIPTLFGSEFAAGSEVLAIFALALPAMFVNYLLLHLLIARGRQGVVTGLNLAVLGLHGAVCLYVVRTYGAVGAAGSVLIAETALLLASAGCLASLRPAPGLLDRGTEGDVLSRLAVVD